MNNPSFKRDDMGGDSVKASQRDIIETVVEVADNNPWQNKNLKNAQYCAALHLRGCLAGSQIALHHGEHSVAVALVRQCIEATSVFEAGLLDEKVGGPLVQGWLEQKLTAGKLRANLEQAVWASYGNGLWQETWANFMTEFIKAVQDYSHYTQRLSLWQLHARTLPVSDEDGMLLVAASVGPDTTDHQKTGQVEVLHNLLLWSLGRLIRFHRPKFKDRLKPVVDLLCSELHASGYLAEGFSWSDMLLPVLWERGSR